MLNGDRFAHDVDLAGVSPLIVRGDIAELEAVIFAETHPRILPNDQVSGRQDPIGLFPHHNKVVQVDHLAR